MSVSEWSGRPGRFRAFYDWPAPVEFEATLPDDLDGPEDERQFLLDEAPFAKLAAVRVERADLPSSVAAPGRTPVPADTEERDGRKALSGALRGAEFGDAAAALAEVLDPVAFNPAVKVENVGQSWDRYRRQEVAFEHAVNALRADWRLVSEDEATVERVARAIHAAECGPEAHCNLTTEHFAWDVRMARAAVRALREGGAS